VALQRDPSASYIETCDIPGLWYEQPEYCVSGYQIIFTLKESLYAKALKSKLEDDLENSSVNQYQGVAFLLFFQGRKQKAALIQ
jgi:hypothetical protein